MTGAEYQVKNHPLNKTAEKILVNMGKTDRDWTIQVSAPVPAFLRLAWYCLETAASQRYDPPLDEETTIEEIWEIPEGAAFESLLHSNPEEQLKMLSRLTTEDEEDEDGNPVEEDPLVLLETECPTDYRSAAQIVTAVTYRLFGSDPSENWSVDGQMDWTAW